MQEALLAVAVVTLVVVIGELVRRNRPALRCPTCGSTSLLVVRESDVMRECGACGRIFSL